MCVCVVVVSVEERWENQNCSYHQSLNQSLTLVDGLTDSQPGLVLEAKMSQLIRFSGKTVTEKITVVDRQHREVVLATVSVEIWGRSARQPIRSGNRISGWVALTSDPSLETAFLSK